MTIIAGNGGRSPLLPLSGRLSGTNFMCAPPLLAVERHTLILAKGHAARQPAAAGANRKGIVATPKRKGLQRPAGFE